jgi:serine phosphatase RsbU (regulator of sigma subunit)
LKTYFRYILIVFAACSAFFGAAQNKTAFGKFKGTYFSVKEFGSAIQIWTGAQATDGVVYFGNDQEIISFNGYKWGKVKATPSNKQKIDASKVNGTRVLKIVTGTDGVTYIGRKDNFGYLSYSNQGQVVYEPLRNAAKEGEIGEIWNIVEGKGKNVYFIAKNQVFCAKNKQVKVVEVPRQFKEYTCMTSCALNNGVLLIYSADKSDSKRPIKRYAYLDFASQAIKEVFLPKEVKLLNCRGVVNQEGSNLIFDYSGLIFRVSDVDNTLRWDSNPSTFFKSVAPKPNVVKQRDGLIYVGTESEGVFVFNATGQLVRKFDLADGMDNLNVFDLFHDKDGNLWLNLDNGIHFFETSSPLTSFGKNEGITAPIQAIDFGLGTTLLATTTDIFQKKTEVGHTSFFNSDYLKETTYDIKTIKTKEGNKTLVVGYNGIYEISHSSRKRIVETYAWTLCQNPLNANEVFVGSETGLTAILLENGSWKSRDILPDLGGDVIQITALNSKLYFGVRGKGVYEYDITSKKHRLFSLNTDIGKKTHYYVSTFQGKIYAGIASGLHVLDMDKGTLKPFKELQGKFVGDDKIQIHRIYNQKDDKLWLVLYREKEEDDFEIEIGYLKKSKNWSWSTWATKDVSEAGIVFAIKEAANGELWFGCNNGLYVLNPAATDTYASTFDIAFASLSSSKKTLAYQLKFSKPIGEIAYLDNTVQFSVYSTSFNGFGNIKYRYFLEGFSDEWSEWSDLNSFQFQKLAEGRYTLKVQAMNSNGLLSNEIATNFTILPPWYRTWWAMMLYAILFITLIYGVIQLSILRVKQKNRRLEEIVSERTHEIAEQNKVLEVQKAEIVHKSNDILDSIKYAKRIQDTILPSSTQLNALFSDYFVFYRPKDIVCGDFYWAKKINEKVIFSAVDCTGHGVPGALVSIVGNNGLIRCVNEFHLDQPASILDKLREIVISAFQSSGNDELKDGMDISLCSIDFKEHKLYYAGANNECVIVRNQELIELKPDKQPIGHFENPRPFSQHVFDLQKGDSIYLFTDGYVDQFGGEKGKKLKSKPFKMLLQEISVLSMKEQLGIIETTFDNWKGELEQVDDVCVFGVKI